MSCGAKRYAKSQAKVPPLSRIQTSQKRNSALMPFIQAVICRWIGCICLFFNSCDLRRYAATLVKCNERPTEDARGPREGFATIRSDIGLEHILVRHRRTLADVSST